MTPHLRRGAGTLAVSIAVAGCNPTRTASGEQPTSPSTGHREPDRAARRPPLRVRIDGPSHVEPDTDITLRLVFHRTVTSVPLRYDVALPAGATLVDGARTGSIGDAAPTAERRLVVHVAAVPASDIVLHADQSERAFGARAVQRYTFGRGTELLPDPPRSAAPTLLNHQNLGHSIHLSPDPKPRPKP